MKKFIFYLLIVIAAAESVVLVSINRKRETKVLSEKIETTPITASAASPTPEATPTSKPTPRPTPIPTPTLPPLPKYTPAEVNGFVERFAGQYGVDPNVLRYIAICESGFNPSAYHAGYAGLFQFGAATWKNLRKEIGEDVNSDLRYDAEEAAQTAAYAFAKGRAGIWPNCRP